MTRFSKAILKDGKLVETEVRDIDQRDLMACPHFILMPRHYREDGTCRCNDSDDPAMRGWGYRWDGVRWR